MKCSISSQVQTWTRLNATGLAMASALLAVGCPRPVVPPKAARPAAAPTPVQAPLEAIPAAAQAKLQARLDAIGAAREELKAVIALVPAEKEEAQALENALAAAKTRLGKDTVKREMDRAAKELDAAQQLAASQTGNLDDGQRRAIGLMERAKKVDAALTSALAPLETASAQTSVQERRLRSKVVEQQRALQSLATATRLAFRSLTVIEQLKRTIPRLKATPTP